MLDGIIYLQDVSNIGKEILTSDQLTAIHEFCGLQNLTMVMTMRQDYPVSQNSWKQKMSEEPFKAILEQGAHLVRYYGDAATALSLFPRFLRTQGQPQGDQEDPIHTPSTEADVGSLGMIFDEESGGLQGLGGTGEVKEVDVPRWPSVNGGQWNFGHEPKRGSEAVKEAAPAGREDTDSEHVALVNQLKKQHSAITQSLNKMLEDERQLRIQTQNTLEEAQREQISLASKHEVQIAEANTRYHQAIEELQKVKQERDNNNAYIREMKSNFDRQKATLRAELTKLKQELDARPVMTIDNGGEEGGGNAHLDGRSDLVPPESDIGNSTSGNGGGDRPGKVTWWRKLVC